MEVDAQDHAARPPSTLGGRGAALVRGTARGALRGIGAGAAMASAGIAFNAFVLALAARVATGAETLVWWRAAAGFPLLVLAGLVFSVAYLTLAMHHGRKVMLRAWYDTHAAELLPALEHAARRATAAAPAGLRRASGAGWRTVAGALRTAPRPLRVIAVWVIRRVGMERLRTLAAGSSAGPGSSLDELIRGELLSTGTRSFWILVLVNAAAAFLVSLAIG